MSEENARDRTVVERRRFPHNALRGDGRPFGRQKIAVVRIGKDSRETSPNVAASLHRRVWCRPKGMSAGRLATFAKSGKTFR